MELNRANFSGATLFKINLSEANLKEANLTNAILKEANLDRANLRRASLRKADFEASSLQDAIFEQAILDDACFKESQLSGTSFRRASLRGTNFKQANLIAVSFNGANLEKSDLSLSILHYAKFDNLIEIYKETKDGVEEEEVFTTNLKEVNWLDADASSIRVSPVHLFYLPDFVKKNYGNTFTISLPKNSADKKSFIIR